MKKFAGVGLMAILIVMGTNAVASAWVGGGGPPKRGLPWDMYIQPAIPHSSNDVGWPWYDVKLRVANGYPHHTYTEYSSFKTDDVYLLSPMGLYYPPDELSRRIQSVDSLRPLATILPYQTWGPGTPIGAPRKICRETWRYQFVWDGTQFLPAGFIRQGYYRPQGSNWINNPYVPQPSHSTPEYPPSQRWWWPDAPPLSPDELGRLREADRLKAVTIKSDTGK